MTSTLSHLQFNTNPANIGFYRALFDFLGWQVLFEADGMLGLADGNGTSVWFTPIIQEWQNNYDGAGLNHLALGVSSIAEVDSTVEYLAKAGVPALFETPRHRPDFVGSESETYYQVMFESPDRILFEVVYIGPK